MTRPVLSARVEQIYNFLVTYTAENGFPPSVREIGKEVGLKSPSTVHMHLQTLEDKGLIQRMANKSRTIKIVGPYPAEPKTPQEPQTDNVVPIDVDVHAGTISLPLVGRVAAGTPILATENVEETICLPTSLVGDAGSFILKVQGSSMINVGIYDGDYLVVKETPTAYNGEIVVALIDDSATVKTFYKEEGRIRLQPENDTMEPIYAEDPLILGRVVALFRNTF